MNERTMAAAAIWVALAASGQLPLTLLIVLVAPLVLVPVAIELLADAPSAAVRRWLSVGAGCAVVSALLPVGAVAGVVALGWPAAAAGLVLGQVRRVSWRRPPLQVAALAWVPIAGMWLAASRAGLRPFGFGEPIVLLTSAHFHVAGFATTMLVSTVRDRLRGQARMRRWATAAAACTTVGPLFVAAGWQTGVAALNATGAVLLTVGIALLAPCTFVATRNQEPTWARRAARISAVAPATPMVWALAYAAARLLDLAGPSITFMVRAHGAVNALGFAALGLVAWTAMRDPNGAGALRIGRPDPAGIARFHADAHARPLSSPLGMVGRPPRRGWFVDRCSVDVGDDLDAAAAAVHALDPFEQPWLTHHRDGDLVTLVVRVGPLWATNACRITEVRPHGFTYATIQGHGERGEESFDVVERDGRVPPRPVVHAARAALRAIPAAPVPPRCRTGHEDRVGAR
jgi:uncharacterized protein (UPF0548 family)